MTTWPEPLILRQGDVSLVPLHTSHADELIEAAKDGDLHTLWYTSVPSPERMLPEIERRLTLQAKGSMLPFTVLVGARAVGMTTYMNIDAVNKRVEIGSTWYAKAVQRTRVNTRAKLALLTHAFEGLGVIAVEFRTHFFNHQSRRAIERLGAKLDGVLRNHQVMADGSMRDTCVYSILPGEWPAVKTHLNYQLARHGAAAATD